MRFKLTLTVNKETYGNILPLNYQYELSAVIYKILSRASESYSNWLHDNGFNIEQYGKQFKLFTFSRLIIDDFKILTESERIIVNSKYVEWVVSFLPEKSTETFIQGIFLNQMIEVGDKKSKVQFYISKVLAIPPPKFETEMSFLALSPICVRDKRNNGTTEYLSPENEKFATGIIAGLKSRYKAIYQKPFPASKVDFSFALESEPKSALITIKAGTLQQTRVKGYMFRFRMKAPIPLLYIMYESGAGEECSQGFGCIETQKSPQPIEIEGQRCD